MKALRAQKITAALANARDVTPSDDALFEQPALLKLEARFKELQNQAFRDLVEAAVELGGA